MVGGSQSNVATPRPSVFVSAISLWKVKTFPSRFPTLRTTDGEKPIPARGLPALSTARIWTVRRAIEDEMDPPRKQRGRIAATRLAVLIIVEPAA